MKQIFLKPTLCLLTILALSACNGKGSSDKHKIASIPEASGISYCHNSNTLVVANDEGAYYEITPNGAILSQHKLGKYDLEGVVCEDNDFIFAVEDGSILVVSRSNSDIKKLKLKGKRAPKLSKKSGIEGIAKIGSEYYLTVQTKEEKEAQFIVIKLGANHAKVKEIIDHGIIDSAGMELFDQKLYIVSDKKDKLYVYDLKRNKILKKVKLPKFAQEGITFDNQSNIFFADDDGAVMKYTQKELGM
ncbi:SdiA-regulated domain-containing protein [bacterium]|nr:SdiA-regulated domain-containing protein [bacterium]MBU1957517.1 SdiA-regulated domain-containing protein [bacterium]